MKSRLSIKVKEKKTHKKSEDIEKSRADTPNKSKEELDFNIEKIVSISKSTFFQQQIRSAFIKYDYNKSNSLDRDELRMFIDDLRSLQNQSASDDTIFNKIMNIIDADNSGTVELDEFYESLATILPVLARPGQHMEKIVRKAFKDFDTDGSGYLERAELKLLFNQTCDRMGVERCNDLQVDYLVSLIDNDQNNMIDADEFLENYYCIHRELSKNMYTNEEHRKKDIFNEKNVRIKEIIEKDEDFMNTFTEVCRGIQKGSKNKSKPKEDDDECKLRKLTTLTNKHAKQFIPMDTFINRPSVTNKKNDDTISDEDLLNDIKTVGSSIDVNPLHEKDTYNNDSAFTSSPLIKHHKSTCFANLRSSNFGTDKKKLRNLASDDNVLNRYNKIQLFEKENFIKIENMKNNERSADEIMSETNWSDKFKEQIKTVIKTSFYVESFIDNKQESHFDRFSLKEFIQVIDNVTKMKLWFEKMLSDTDVYLRSAQKSIKNRKMTKDSLIVTSAGLASKNDGDESKWKSQLVKVSDMTKHKKIVIDTIKKQNPLNTDEDFKKFLNQLSTTKYVPKLAPIKTSTFDVLNIKTNTDTTKSMVVLQNWPNTRKIADLTYENQYAFDKTYKANNSTLDSRKKNQDFILEKSSSFDRNNKVHNSTLDMRTRSMLEKKSGNLKHRTQTVRNDNAKANLVVRNNNSGSPIPFSSLKNNIIKSLANEKFTTSNQTLQKLQKSTFATKYLFEMHTDKSKVMLFSPKGPQKLVPRIANNSFQNQKKE